MPSLRDALDAAERGGWRQSQCAVVLAEAQQVCVCVCVCVCVYKVAANNETSTI